MTILFASISSSFIAVTADSAITRYFEDHREYDRGKKIESYEGLGVVATWGERTGNKIFQYLSENISVPSKLKIEDLAGMVDDYLRSKYQPHKDQLSRVGYYVLGYDEDLNPKFFGILWAEQTRHPASSADRRYHCYDNSPGPGAIRFSYDGRFNLVHSLLGLYLEELNSGSDVKFDLSDPIDRIRLHDFVIRFASEITPEVDAPFITKVITPKFKITDILNRELSPLKSEGIAEKLHQLGLLRN